MPAQNWVGFFYIFFKKLTIITVLIVLVEMQKILEKLKYNVFSFLKYLLCSIK